MINRLSLSARFALLVILLVVGVSLALSTLASWQLLHLTRGSIGNSVFDITKQLSNALDRSMDARMNELGLLLSVIAADNDSNPDQIRERLEELQRGYDVPSWIGYMDRDGTVVASTGGILEGASMGPQPAFMRGETEMWVGNMPEATLLTEKLLLPDSESEKEKFLNISAPVVDSDGNLQGVVAVHLSWHWARNVKRSMFSSDDDGPVRDIFVVDRGGLVLTGPEDQIGSKLDQFRLGEEDSFAEKSGWSVLDWADDGEHLTGWTASTGHGRFGGQEWSVVARESVNAALSPLAHLQRNLAITGVLLAAVFALLGWLIANKLASPLSRLSHAADRIGDGTGAGAEQIPLDRSSPEMFRLSTSLRAMVERILNQRRTIDHLHELAHSDSLTGLPNRAFLGKYLKHMGLKTDDNNQVLVFMYLDLDGFKLINDILGHHAGDVMLVEIATRVRECLRPEDIAVRLGGDEFVIVLQCAPLEARSIAKDVSKRILDSISAAVPLPEDDQARVGCSIGAAIWPEHGETFEDVMSHADTALYTAKEAGKNQLVLYDET